MENLMLLVFLCETGEMFSAYFIVWTVDNAVVVNSLLILLA